MKGKGMKILRVLIRAMKELLHETIERNGLLSLETISLSQRLDKLIYIKQKSIAESYINC